MECHTRLCLRSETAANFSGYVIKEDTPRFDSHLGTLFSYDSSAFVFLRVTHAPVNSLILSGREWAANIASSVLFVSTKLSLLICGRKNPAVFTVHSGSHVFFIVGSLLFQLLTHSKKKKKKKSPSPCCPATWWLHRSVHTRGSLLTTPETTETHRQINQKTREGCLYIWVKPKKCTEHINFISICSVLLFLALLQAVDTSQTYPNVVEGGFAGDVIEEKQSCKERNTNKKRGLLTSAAAHLETATLEGKKINQSPSQSVVASARLTVCVSIIRVCHTSKPFLSCRVPNLWQTKKKGKRRRCTWWLGLVPLGRL